MGELNKLTPTSMRVATCPAFVGAFRTTCSACFSATLPFTCSMKHHGALPRSSRVFSDEIRWRHDQCLAAGRYTPPTSAIEARSSSFTSAGQERLLLALDEVLV